MAAHQSHQVSRAAIMTTGRRQAMTGLFAGAAVTMYDPTGVIEAKGKKKKKKCKKPNKCPQRNCCTCWDPNTFVDVLCGYVAPDEGFDAACTGFCESHALEWHHASGAVAGQANYCDHDLQCVRLDCPVT